LLKEEEQNHGRGSGKRRGTLSFQAVYGPPFEIGTKRVKGAGKKKENAKVTRIYDIKSGAQPQKKTRRRTKALRRREGREGDS